MVPTGLVNIRETRKPTITEMEMAMKAARPIALKVRSRNAVSALVSSASLPSTHRRASPMRRPSAVMMGTVTADSGSVGALETGLCSLAWRAGSVSSYRILPVSSVTCRPISSERAPDSAMAARDSRFQPPSTV